MDNQFRFENLQVYKEALIIIDIVYLFIKKFPSDENFGISNQLRRAIVSIALNIAEGSSRSQKDFQHFLSISRGSCFECIAILTICKNQKFINEEEFKLVYS